MIARLQIRDRLADLLDHAGGLMTEDRGRGKRIVAVHEMQVAVADARRGGAEQNFVVARIVDIDLLDRKRLFGSVKNCCFHDVLSLDFNFLS